MLEPTFADFDAGAVFVRNIAGTLLRVTSADNKRVLWPVAVEQPVPPVVEALSPPVVEQPAPPVQEAIVQEAVAHEPPIMEPAIKKKRRRLRTSSLPQVSREAPSAIPVPIQEISTWKEANQWFKAVWKEEFLKLQQPFEAGYDEFIESHILLRNEQLSHIFWEWAARVLLIGSVENYSDFTSGIACGLLTCCRFIRKLDQLSSISDQIEAEFAKPYSTLLPGLPITPQVSLPIGENTEC